MRTSCTRHGSSISRRRYSVGIDLAGYSPGTFWVNYMAFHYNVIDNIGYGYFVRVRRGFGKDAIGVSLYICTDHSTPNQYIKTSITETSLVYN